MNTIGNYRLVEEIYGSGKTRVCRAIRVADCRPVVLKIISGERAQPIDAVHCRREFEATREFEDVEDIIKVHALESVEEGVRQISSEFRMGLVFHGLYN